MDRQDLQYSAASVSLVDDDILAEFLSRQDDLLGEMEQAALDLEGLSGKGASDELLRYFHTLKGEAGLLGFTEMADVCHSTESMLQSGTGDCVDQLLAVKDWLGNAFAAVTAGEKFPDAVDLLEMLNRSAVDSAERSASVAEPVPGLLAADQEALRDFLDESSEHLEAAEASLLILEENPDAEEPVNRAFRAFHTIKGVAAFLDLDAIEKLSHRAENLLDTARGDGPRLGGERMDTALAAVDMLHRLHDDVMRAAAADGILREQEGYDDLIANLDRLTGARRREPESGRSSGLFVLNPIEKGEPDSSAGNSARNAGKVVVREAVRVDAGRLNKLVEALGEMVIAEAMVSHAGELRKNISSGLRGHLDNLDKISRELQEIGLSLRMMPVRPVFQKMNRLARDLARKTGRPVELTISGEDTELDRAVVDKISDPLVHMVRNAVDHGIEADVAERKAAGKPETGRIELRAFHRGGNICIEIADDGRGLDRDAILAKAVSRGLVGAGDELEDREIYNLIFEPGFSTAEKVTDVSGRGVGMDVVRRNIESLRGSVEIDSRRGEGSTFSILLPLTLAIIDGMVLKVGTELYIVPTLAMVRLVRPEPGEVSGLIGRGEILDFEGRMIPLLRMSDLFGVDGLAVDSRDGVVVVVEDGSRRVGLLADSLIGQQQIVIKSLGESIQGTPGLAGGAILSDGRVAPILDVAFLIRSAGNGNA